LRDGGRLAAAIVVLGDMESRHKPVRMALKTWGDSARYAGARDRAFVSGLVLDVLRRRRSLAWLMAEESDRARVLAALHAVWGWPFPRILDALADPHGPGMMTDEELDRFVRMERREARPRIEISVDIAGIVKVDGVEIPSAMTGGMEALSAYAAEVDRRPPYLRLAPEPVRGDYSDWLDPLMERVFGEDRAAEGEALAERAPVDLRINTLKTDMARALKALAPFDPQISELLPAAIRVAAPAASERAAPLEAAPEFEKGWFEVQDLGSQLAAARAGDIAGRQVLDFCAGGGGKTLALAAAMGNRGQLYAYDADARRLTDTVRRAQRAGVRNLQVRSPIHPGPLDGLEGRMDLVFVDAPCTGSGTWRRHPDAKWRLTAEQLARRMAEQDAVLSQAAAFVKPAGRLIYVTCSLFAEENEDRVTAFLAARPDFAVVPAAGPADHFLTGEGFLRLTPRTAGTDGFFVAVVTRSPAVPAQR
jgi:16S rRNA (cytosine967-C5)-methyltransferase